MPEVMRGCLSGALIKVALNRDLAGRNSIVCIYSALLLPRYINPQSCCFSQLMLHASYILSLFFHRWYPLLLVSRALAITAGPVSLLTPAAKSKRTCSRAKGRSRKKKKKKERGRRMHVKQEGKENESVRDRRLQDFINSVTTIQRSTR